MGEQGSVFGGAWRETIQISGFIETGDGSAQCGQIVMVNAISIGDREIDGMEDPAEFHLYSIGQKHFTVSLPGGHSLGLVAQSLQMVMENLGIFNQFIGIISEP